MNVVKGMDQAMKAMDLEKVRAPHYPSPSSLFSSQHTDDDILRFQQ